MWKSMHCGFSFPMSQTNKEINLLLHHSEDNNECFENVMNNCLTKLYFMHSVFATVTDTLFIVSKI